MSERSKLERLAQLKRRAAELHAELAELTSEEAQLLTDDTPAVRSRGKRRHAPKLPPVSDIDSQRAKAALRDNQTKRSMTR